ncbi:MAG: hypothetical protein PHS71_04640 [Proteiniphilum sp.]|nr:hypothetical protein [Proteiniphilum sp.]MDD3969454.1 hypothetical protein [Proteiniphilum sp.]MDD4799605.1 hypothetical protein [Proteiniphilum sp.]
MFKSFFIGENETRLLIIQGGGGVNISLSGLASAVANERRIAQILQKVHETIGVNIMATVSDFADWMRTTMDEKELIAAEFLLRG